MVTELWAHTPGKENPEEWQSLEKHLEGVVVSLAKDPSARLAQSSAQSLCVWCRLTENPRFVAS